MKKIFLLFLIIFSSLQGSENANNADKRLFSHDIKLVQEAITEGANINAKGNYGYTPLIIASANGRLDIAKLLINSGANLDSQDDSGYTALIFASMLSKEAIVDLLIKSGANPNIQTNNGDTALMRTAFIWKINPNIVKLLIDAGTDLNIKDIQGKTALDIAVSSDNKEIATLIKNRIEYLKKSENANNADKRLFSNDIKLVQEAITEGADINGKNHRGFTPLISASANDMLDIAKLLINSGANLDSQTDLGFTALIFATIMDREAIVDLLIKSGANPNIQTRSGRTALMEAALTIGLNTNIVKLLFDAGADLNIKDIQGKTALDIAVSSDNKEVAEIIKNRIEYLKKMIPEFIKAAQEGEVKKLVQLIELGININAQDEDGFTALMRAAQGSNNNPEQANNKLEIVKILLDKGAIY